jgi:hypothetical protein
VRGESLEQPTADAAALEIVGDREGDFGPRAVAQTDVRADANDPRLVVSPGQLADERKRLTTVPFEERCHEMLVDPDSALEAEVKGIRGEVLEEGHEPLAVRPGGRSETQGRPVAKHHILACGGRDHR